MDGCRVVCMALDASRMQVKDEYYPALPLVCAEQVDQEARRMGAVFVGDELSPSPKTVCPVDGWCVFARGGCTCQLSYTKYR